MDKEIASKFPQLTQAILIWTGWGKNSRPRRDDASLVDHFGSDLAAKLLVVIKSLEDDFYASDARFTAADIQEMGEISAEQFKRKHPEISDEVIEAFAWCYTFDFK